MLNLKKSKKLIYLDYAATTYVDDKVFSAMRPFMGRDFGNPSSLYSLGRISKKAINQARDAISKILNCRVQEIIFTAGGTESVNLAIFGVVRNFFLNSNGKAAHIITNKAEHHAVLKTFEALSAEGVACSYINVDREGFVSINELISAIRPETILISIMYANNEVGTIQPISDISKALNKINKNREEAGLHKILFHCDACQAAGFLDLNVQRLGIDLMSLNASKIYGPKQIGLLYKRNGVRIHPLIYGGGQENNMRSGTENTAGIIGFAKALEIADKNKVKENKRLRSLRNYFADKISKIESVGLNGLSIAKDNEKKPLRLPNNLNFSIDGIEGEALMLYLDSCNVCVSTGSACSTSETDPSHVILALGKSRAEAASSIRITLGRKTTKAELDYVLKTMPILIEELRKMAKELN